MQSEQEPRRKNRKRVKKEENVHKKRVENVERGAWFLIKAKIQYLFRVSWDAALRLLSSHSSALMLNFQNFYITKGPTTSAEKYPASTKSVRQPRPCRGETLAFRQLPPAAAPRGESAKEKKKKAGWGDFPISPAFPEDFNPFSLSLGRPGERRGGRRRRRRRRKNKTTTPGFLFWSKNNVNHLPWTRPRCRGIGSFIYLNIYIFNIYTSKSAEGGGVVRGRWGI